MKTKIKQVHINDDFSGSIQCVQPRMTIEFDNGPLKLNRLKDMEIEIKNDCIHLEDVRIGSLNNEKAIFVDVSSMDRAINAYITNRLKRSSRFGGIW
jgi:hypothetical protein